VLLLIIKLENERTLNMEKAKYIVSRLGLIALGTSALAATVYAIGILGRNIGLDPIHIVYGILSIFLFGMLVFWLGEGYEIKKRYESLDK
jgi:hypothetical protein